MYRSVVVQRTSPFKKSPRNLNRAQTAALRYHSALSTMSVTLRLVRIGLVISVYKLPGFCFLPILQNFTLSPHEWISWTLSENDIHAIEIWVQKISNQIIINWKTDENTKFN